VEHDAGALDNLGTRPDRGRCETAHPASRVDGSVARMEDPAVEQTVEGRRELVEPLRGEAVLTKRVELDLERCALAVVGGKPETARASELTAGQLLDRIDRTFGELPQEPRTLRAHALARTHVAHGASTEREAPVASARTSRNPPSLVQTHAQSAP